MKPELYVLCLDERAREAWRTHAPKHTDLDVNLVLAEECQLETIHRICCQRDRPFLVARDDVWIGVGMAKHVECLTAEMNRRYPNWAACGNRGVTWDEQTFDYGTLRNELNALTSVCAHPVISLDDNLLLINPLVLRNHTDRAPSVEQPPFNVAFSLECLANGSVMAVSPQLMTLRTRMDAVPTAKTQIGAEFQRYYRDHFVSHYYPAPGGGWDFSSAVDFGSVAPSHTTERQATFAALFDRGLGAARRKPSLTICCRTQFRRPEMLERAVLSLSVCRSNAELLSDLQIRLVTDQSGETATAGLRRLASRYPSAALDSWFVEVAEARLSRIELLVGAIERAQTDYIWFVDDDDYVNPQALPALARCLVPDVPLLVIANSSEMHETWDGPADVPTGARRLRETTRGETKLARKIFAALRGLNPVPICGMIFPVKLLQQRLRGRATLGEYAEDYFLLLLALTAPRVEVRVLEMELATISLRGLENTVAEQDRSKWFQSYATFLLEALNNPDANSPFLWQLANMPPTDWLEY